MPPKHRQSQLRGGMSEYMSRVLEEPPNNNNIGVAVRIRPPNQRELAGGENDIIVAVKQDAKTGKTVVVKNSDRPLSFEFDYAFGPDVDNEELFSDLGVPVVQNAYHGYNTTLFAYGQTSSGKSYSMVGKLADKNSEELGPNAGVIPRVAALLFDVAKSTPPSHEFFVEASFLEIYNEKVRDLLDPSATELKVRESPKLGVHITGLTKKQVTSGAAVGRVLNAGFVNRTVASTRYNAESSRSHAIFALQMKQLYLHEESGEKMQSHSTINLVDLAGSERSDMVGTTGQQLKEGNNINKSLTVLGRCIKALVIIAKKPALAAKVKPSSGSAPPPRKGLKNKKQAKAAKSKAPARTNAGGIVVPFRESVLTWYLRESLSGNARTTMLAAVSPVILNRDETLSTLRYAASAKNIKTIAEKQEDPMEAKVRALSEEIAQLKAALKAAAAGASPRGSDFADLTEEERVEYLEALSAEMDFDLGKGRLSRQSSSFDGDGLGGVPFPQLTCLNKDEMLSHAMAVSVVSKSPGTPFTIGRPSGLRENDFVLNGVGMHPLHCEIIDRGPEGFFMHTDGNGAIVLVNGVPLEELNSADGPSTCRLNHLDRVTLGPCRMLAMFLTTPMTAEEKSQWTYDVCFQELMHREALQWSLLSAKRRRLLDQLQEAELLYVEHANAIAIDMCTCIRFSATIVLGGTGSLPLLRKAESTLDDVLDGSECDVVIRCSVNPKHIVESSHDMKAQGGADVAEETGDAEKSSSGTVMPGPLDKLSPLQRAESQMLLDGLSETGMKGDTGNAAGDDDDFLTEAPKQQLIDAEDSLESEVALLDVEGTDSREPSTISPKHKKSSRRKSMIDVLSKTDNLTLFEMKMGQFEELLAELKYTHHFVASLSQGVAEDLPLGNDEKTNTVQAIFETVDCDNSGTIDRSELAAAFKLFDETAIDPTFCDRMMHDLLPDDQDALDFDQFSTFLVQFLQHQFLHKLEPFISNQSLFVTLGGRDLAGVIEEERKKEQALEFSNAELAHELHQTQIALEKTKRKAAQKGGPISDKPGDIDADDDDDDDGIDETSGKEGVFAFLKKNNLGTFGPILVEMGVDNISDLLDPELVGEPELEEAGMDRAQRDEFSQAVLSYKAKIAQKDAKEEGGTKPQSSAAGLMGSAHEGYDPLEVNLDVLKQVPVIMMNARSHRKLFAQAGKRPTIFETWAKGFGAGPEEHTFKDNRWWLVPQKNDNSNFVIVNAHSSRKLYAKNIKPGAKWEKEVGAISAEDTSPETVWSIERQFDGSYQIQNTISKRRLYARLPKKSEAWTVGVGASPADHQGSETKWYLIPDHGKGRDFKKQASNVVTHTAKDSRLGSLRQPSISDVVNHEFAALTGHQQPRKRAAI